VALTVMVASFRDSVTRWLDVVLPADLYVRTRRQQPAAATPRSSRRPSCRRWRTARRGARRHAARAPLQLDPAGPPWRCSRAAIEADPRALPLVGAAVPVPAGQIAIYVSEAMVDLYGAGRASRVCRCWMRWASRCRPRRSPSSWPACGATTRGSSAPSPWTRATTSASPATARQRRAAVARARRRRRPGAGGGARAAARQGPAAALVEFASAAQIRATSLRIFDRSFAVTYWLQAVAIAIGLFGVAASFSAQVLARRKEFGLLAHLGSRAGRSWPWWPAKARPGRHRRAGRAGAGAGVAVVLVHVVNPQSFHWTMDLLVPWERLLALCAAVVAAGTLTAWLAGRAPPGATPCWR
jgi:putative ABC transport system permease protein